MILAIAILSAVVLAAKAIFAPESTQPRRDIVAVLDHHSLINFALVQAFAALSSFIEA